MDIWNKSYIEPPWIWNQMKTDMFFAVMNAILATASRSLKNSGLQRFWPVTSHNQITAIIFQFASLPSMPSRCQCQCNANFPFPVTLTWLQSSLSLLDEPSHWDDKQPPLERIWKTYFFILTLSLHYPWSFFQRQWILRARAANDTTRAQRNNIPSKSHVIPLLLSIYAAK